MDDDEEFEYSDDEGDEVQWEEVGTGDEAGEKEEVQWKEAGQTTNDVTADAVEQEDYSNEGEQSGTSSDEYEEPDAEEDDPDEDQDETAQDLRNIDWSEVNAALEREAAASNKKKRKARRTTKADKERELALHKGHLLLLLGVQMKWNKLCQSAILRGLVLSLAVNSPSCEGWSTKMQKYYLQQLMTWFVSIFTVIDEPECMEDMTVQRLMQAFFDRRGSASEVALLFTILCRALKLRCRHTGCLDPLSLQTGRGFEAAFAGTKASPRKRLKKDIEERTAISEDVVEAQSSKYRWWVWTEVLVLDESDTAEPWIPINVVRKMIGNSNEIGNMRGAFAPMAFVVSIEENGQIVDTTARYATRWSSILKSRLADKWFEDTCKQISLGATQLNGPGIAGKTGGDSDESKPSVIDELERKALRTLTEQEELPTSAEGFRKHHVFCLERQLGQFECVHPRKVVGLFKGQPVFLRKNVQVLRTAFKWKRQGRILRESERSKPVKRLLKKKAQADGGGDISDDEGDELQPPSSSYPSGLALYGEWQTDPFVAAPVVDGCLPKNQYGNIEIWSDAHVQHGAAHLRIAHLDRIAQKLGIEFAPAMVGFEARNGKNYPTFDGIVVLAGDVETLMDAHAAHQQKTIEQAITKNRRLIVRRWEKLVKRALIRIRLNRDYGTVSN
ncbi:TPA: hypothetical protein N0F65_005510 [Lagenidium giganteum]|uniref:Uncharacterized protein n=1 Tax=Lagenidium giganteum TaxID=4803 RepID=A0AAV2YGJ8_9STRA|nr:TPA: hypothetical protein N0F65_005510 [Lagenidium giganteum]